MTNETSGDLSEKLKDGAASVLEKADQKENQALNNVEKVQSAINKVTPVPNEFKTLAPPKDLKARLDWGEPALSILDLRDRAEFNHERITGAMPIPHDQLLAMAQSAFTPNRDLFIYGDSDEDALAAVSELQGAGFQRVCAIRGGLGGWKAIGGATEGQMIL
jgi:rhodanese-related sulfurtransferase